MSASSTPTSSCTCCRRTRQRPTGRRRSSRRGVVSVQVLNEFAAVASRKLRMPWSEIRDVLSQLRAVCAIEPVTLETHDGALHIAERYGLSIYDALIVSAGLRAGCRTPYSEDMQDGQVIEGRLAIRNPVRPS